MLFSLDKMKRCFAIILLLATTSSRAEVPVVMRGEEALHQDSLAHPRPEYPYASRAKHLSRVDACLN